MGHEEVHEKSSRCVEKVATDGLMIGKRPGLNPIIDLCWMLAMMLLKCILFIFVPVSQYASHFTFYLVPSISAWLLGIGVVCWVPMLFFTLSALFRRRWKAVARFSLAWLVVVLPQIGYAEPLYWVEALGFRIHVSPVGQYLSRCRLTEFDEKGVAQTVGLCEGRDEFGDVTNIVFYDTSGEIALPLSQRTPEWKDAMWHYPPKGVLRDSEGRAWRLVGDFYSIDILLTEFDGDSSE